jgi:hypothetical protein
VKRRKKKVLLIEIQSPIKRRNPLAKAAKEGRFKGGKHRDKKKDYKRNPKHKQDLKNIPE